MMNINIIVINTVVSILYLAGLILTIIGLPGNMIIMIIALGYGYYEGFVQYTYTFLAMIALIYLMAEGIEFLAAAISGKKEKAATETLVAAFAGAVLGAVLGTAVLPLFGSMAGAAAGAFAASYVIQYWKTKDSQRSFAVAKSIMLGQITGMVIKVIFGAGMAGACIYRMNWG